MTQTGGSELSSRQALVPLILVAITVAAVAVAAVAGKPVWAAALGAGLMLASWAVEALVWRRGSAAPFGAALGVALGGMVLRLALVLGVLVLVGVLARPAFATAAVSFLAALTVYVGVRLFTYPALAGPAGQAGSR